MTPPAVVAVTGATGWVGRAACEVLVGEYGETRIVPFASSAKTLVLQDGVTLPVRPLDELPDTPHDVLLHFAYVTREFLDRVGTDPYIAANAAITAAVRGAITAVRPRAVLHASSGAAASAGSDLLVDPYAVLKRMDEDTLRTAARDVDARIVTLRIFNLAGPWMAKRGFAIGSLVDQLDAGGPVTIHAQRPVLRSYTDVEDAVRVAIGACTAPGLDDDLRLETGGEPIELGALAERAAAALGRAEPEIHRTWDPLAPPDAYLGDRGAFDTVASKLGIPLHDLDAQIRRTALSPTKPVTT